MEERQGKGDTSHFTVNGLISDAEVSDALPDVMDAYKWFSIIMKCSLHEMSEATHPHLPPEVNTETQVLVWWHNSLNCKTTQNSTVTRNAASQQHNRTPSYTQGCTTLQHTCSVSRCLNEEPIEALHILGGVEPPDKEHRNISHTCCLRLKNSHSIVLT